MMMMMMMVMMMMMMMIIIIMMMMKMMMMMMMMITQHMPLQERLDPKMHIAGLVFAMFECTDIAFNLTVYIHVGLHSQLKLCFDRTRSLVIAVMFKLEKL